MPTSSIALECPEDKRDFLGMLNLKGELNPFTDITLKLDGADIQCHQVILASRSLYFEAVLAHDFKEKEQRVVDFASNAEGINRDSFILMLKHIYSDSLRVEPRQIYDLLSVSVLCSHSVARRQVRSELDQEEVRADSGSTDLCGQRVQHL